MVKIILSNKCSSKLDILKNTTWIKIDDPITKCDLLITEEIVDIDTSIYQIIFTGDVSSILLKDNIFVGEYKSNLNEYLDYICECLRNKIAVNVFGDSHSIITHKITICRENWLGFNTNYPLTMFRFGNEGLDLHEAIRVMGNGHENYPIRKGDIVMYSYGEIDVRYLILKHCKNINVDDNLTGNHYNNCREIDILIDKLISNYLDKIRFNEEKYGCTTFVYFIIPPVHKIEGMNMFSGSLEERIALYKVFTERLYKMCKNNNIPVISIYDTISNSNGTCNETYLVKEGDIHINNDYYYLIRDKIMEELCNIVN